jgi:hypothetical protein
MNDEIKAQKPLVIIGPALVPVIGGAIVYYGLRDHNETMAKLGNRVSWLAFFAWIAGGFVLPSWVLVWAGAAWLGGVVVSIVAVYNIRRATKDAAVDG